MIRMTEAEALDIEHQMAEQAATINRLEKELAAALEQLRRLVATGEQP